MWTGSQASHHWNHQSQRCPAGNGNAECFQHYNSCAQHCNGGAADGGFGGKKRFSDDKQAQNVLERSNFAVDLCLGTLFHLTLCHNLCSKFIISSKASLNYFFIH